MIFAVCSGLETLRILGVFLRFILAKTLLERIVSGSLSDFGDANIGFGFRNFPKLLFGIDEKRGLLSVVNPENLVL